MSTPYTILLFDGVCNLCNNLVRFIIKQDPDAKIRFAPLQSTEGKLLLEQFKLNVTEPESVVYIVYDKCFIKSSAVLNVLFDLDGGWRLFYGFIIVPKFIRDFFYDLIAKNRFRIFGKKDICMVPTPDIVERFIV